MNTEDEKLRDLLTDGLAHAGIDARSLTIDVIGGAVIIRGSVATEGKRRQLGQAVASCMPGLAWRIDVVVRPAARTSASAQGERTLLFSRDGVAGTFRRPL